MTSSHLIVGGNFETRKNSAIQLIGKILHNEHWSPLSNPDFLLVEETTSIGIERIRSLQNQLKLKPFGQEKKIAFFSQAETATVEAQNALLKILEEPSEKTLFILSAPSPEWLLPTIVSRCQIIQLPLAPQISLTKDETKEFQDFFKKVSSVKIGEKWLVLEELGIFQDRNKAIEWVDKMTFFVRKLLIDENLKDKSSKFLISQYLNILISLSRTKIYLEANTNIRLTLENFLLMEFGN